MLRHFPLKFPAKITRKIKKEKRKKEKLYLREWAEKGALKERSFRQTKKKKKKDFNKLEDLKSERAFVFQLGLFSRSRAHIEIERPRNQRGKERESWNLFYVLIFLKFEINIF